MTDLLNKIKEFVDDYFKVSISDFVLAIKINYSAKGYLYGAVSELLLRRYLKKGGYEVKRIKEKPKGGAKGKSSEARGDFYIRKPGDEKWLVVECKGLKSNSETADQIANLTTKKKLKSFLKKHALIGHGIKDYEVGKKDYERAKKQWEDNNNNKTFPDFGWSKDKPGKCNCELKSEKLWKDEKELDKWVEKIPNESISEDSYRDKKGPVIVLATHAPSKRKGNITDKEQAAPLVADFSILAIDLFIKTGEHKFVFLNPMTISHSPTSPEHLYQNYIIDILIPCIKDTPKINIPWYEDIDRCINETKPIPRGIIESQLDNRLDEMEETELETTE